MRTRITAAEAEQIAATAVGMYHQELEQTGRLLPMNLAVLVQHGALVIKVPLRRKIAARWDQFWAWLKELPGRCWAWLKGLWSREKAELPAPRRDDGGRSKRGESRREEEEGRGRGEPTQR